MKIETYLNEYDVTFEVRHFRSKYQEEVIINKVIIHDCYHDINCFDDILDILDIKYYTLKQLLLDIYKSLCTINSTPTSAE